MSIPKMDTSDFRVVLNGEEDLQAKMLEFKELCDAQTQKHHKRQRCKRRYYHIGLMARISEDTTLDELQRLLKIGARTFLIDLVIYRHQEIRDMMTRVEFSISEFVKKDERSHTVTGMAVEIRGDCCRLGRMRNGCSVFVEQGMTLTLTTDFGYRYCGYKEIVYVINLKYYVRCMNLGDEIFIGCGLVGRVVKIFRSCLTLMIIQPGVLSSYDYLEIPNQCYGVDPEAFPYMYREDLRTAVKLKANYIVVKKIRCRSFLQSLKENLPEGMKLIGALDMRNTYDKMVDLISLINPLDYLWIPDLFDMENNLQNFLERDVIPLAKSIKCHIIGNIPLESCQDFKKFESHTLLWKIDSMFIEKSRWCNKYPLIVKKLLPVRDYRFGYVDTSMELKNILVNLDTVANFIIRTISTIECQGIVMYTTCEVATEAMARAEIYCPVYVVLSMDGENDACKIDLARSFNLRRNLQSIMYTEDMNSCKYSPVEYGLDYLRKECLAQTGDFVITIEVAKQQEEDVEYGEGDDVVILRALYMPPCKTCEQFKYVA